MKTHSFKLLVIFLGAFVLQGCVAFPPLLQVEHRHEAPSGRNDELMRRLDSIDQRLNRLERAQQAP